MQPRSHQEVLGKFLGQKTKFVVINFKVEGGKIQHRRNELSKWNSVFKLEY